MKEEINRIINLIPKVDNIEIENDIAEITEAGFTSQEDYNFVKSIKERFDNFLQYVEEWDGLEEQKLDTLRVFVYAYLLRNKDTNV